MDTRDKVEWLFNQTYGPVGSNLRLEVEDDLSVSVLKDGRMCYEVEAVELLLDYLTRDMLEEAD